MAADTREKLAEQERCCACRIFLNGMKINNLTQMDHLDGEMKKLIFESFNLDSVSCTDGFCEDCFNKISSFQAFITKCSNRDKADKTSAVVGSTIGIAISDTSVPANAPVQCIPSETLAENNIFEKDQNNIRDRIKCRDICSQNSPRKLLQKQLPTSISTVDPQVQVSNSAGIIPPLNVPTGTLMLKKDSSTVYILPNGTTYELPNNKTSGQGQCTTTLSNKVLASNKRTFQPILSVNKTRNEPDKKKTQLNGSSDPTIIITDCIPVPTLLVPPTNPLFSKLLSPLNPGKLPISPLKKVIKIHGPPPILPKTGVSISPEFQCQKCQILFSSEGPLKEHMKIHPDVRSCVICNKLIWTEKEVINHIKKMHPRHMCPVGECGFYSAHLPSLKNHALVHCKQKDFKCVKCEKAFKTKAYLSSHTERCHISKEKVFTCDICEKKFKWNSSLQSHLKFHTRGAFKCPQCEHKVQSQESLDRHIRAFHNASDSPHVCEECGQICADRHSKERHQKTHYKDEYKTVTCPVNGCDFREYDEYRVRNHVQRVHQKNTVMESFKKAGTLSSRGSTSEPSGEVSTTESSPVCILDELTPSIPNQNDPNISPDEFVSMETSEKLEVTIHKLRERLQPPPNTNNEESNSGAQEGVNEHFSDKTSNLSVHNNPSVHTNLNSFKQQRVPEEGTSVEMLVNEFLLTNNHNSNILLSPCDDVVYNEVVVESCDSI